MNILEIINNYINNNLSNAEIVKEIKNKYKNPYRYFLIKTPIKYLVVSYNGYNNCHRVRYHSEWINKIIRDKNKNYMSI